MHSSTLFFPNFPDNCFIVTSPPTDKKIVYFLKKYNYARIRLTFFIFLVLSSKKLVFLLRNPILAQFIKKRLSTFYPAFATMQSGRYVVSETEIHYERDTGAAFSAAGQRI